MTSDQPDMDDVLRQALQMKEQLESAQADAAAQIVEGQSGGGVVKVTASGAMDFRSVSIDASAVDPE
ncbi:MAG: YbaB/EbfC family nucleoid-associated protein, partial [Acidimicrobiales bacterium]